MKLHPSRSENIPSAGTEVSTDYACTGEICGNGPKQNSTSQPHDPTQTGVGLGDTQGTF